MYIDYTGMYPRLRHPNDVRELSPAELGATMDPRNPDMPGLPTRTLTSQVTPGVDLLSRRANVDLNQLPFNPQLFDYSDPQVGQQIGDLEVIEKHDDGSITVFNRGQTVRVEPGARYLVSTPDGRGSGRSAGYGFVALPSMVRGVLPPGRETRVDR